VPPNLSRIGQVTNPNSCANVIKVAFIQVAGRRGKPPGIPADEEGESDGNSVVEHLDAVVNAVSARVIERLRVVIDRVRIEVNIGKLVDPIVIENDVENRRRDLSNIIRIVSTRVARLLQINQFGNRRCGRDR